MPHTQLVQWHCDLPLPKADELTSEAVSFRLAPWAPLRTVELSAAHRSFEEMGQHAPVAFQLFLA